MPSNFRSDFLQFDTMRLQSALDSSRLQKENNAVYQVILGLLKNLGSAVDGINALSATVASLSTTINNSSSQQLLIPTFLDEGGGGGDGDIGPPGLKGDTGATGATGAPANSILVVLDEPGEEEVISMPGPQGTPGTPGTPGSIGETGPALFMLAEDGAEGDAGPPGRIGIDGTSGTQGEQGPAIFFTAEDGADGDTFVAIGRDGAAGATGAAGRDGVGVPGEDGEPGEDGFFQFGFPGNTGPQGLVGPSQGMRFERFTAEVTAGRRNARSGRFDHEVFIPFTIAQVGQPVLVEMAGGVIKGRGYIGDESEWDYINCTGEIVSRKKLRVRWNSITRVRGKYNFQFLCQLNPLSTLNLAFGTTYRSFGFTIGDGITVIGTGLKGYTPPMPANGTLLQAYVQSADTSTPATSGSISIDVWKTNFYSYPPTSSNSITGYNYITLAGAKQNSMIGLAGWNTAFLKDDVYAFNVQSVTGLTKAQVTLLVSIP